jgi:hypothetical protein
MILYDRFVTRWKKIMMKIITGSVSSMKRQRAFWRALHRLSRRRGVGNLNFVDDVFVHGDSDGEIFHVITDGVKDTQMKGFRKELTGVMRWHLVIYVKSLKATSQQ